MYILQHRGTQPRFGGDFERTRDHCAALRNTSRAAEAAGELRRKLGAVISPQWFSHNHKAFGLIIFIFVTVTRFTRS
jgi:hypothetical protein